MRSMGQAGRQPRSHRAHIDAIRRVDRYGVGTLDQAFAGYDALPPPGSRQPAALAQGCFGFLDGHVVTAAGHRDPLKGPRQAQHHPDLGGSHEAMAQLNEARDAALRETGRGVG